MENKNKLSFLIPCYNVENSLLITYNSIRKYFSDAKILMLNDFSSDTTLKVMSDIKKTDENVFLFENEKNMGCGSTKNKLVELCDSEYFWIVDADDEIRMPVNISIDSLLGRNYDFIHGMTSTHPIFKHLTLETGEYFKITNNELFSLYHATDCKIFKTSFFKNLNTRLWPGNYEDTILYSIYPKATSFYFIRDIIYIYKYNDKSITRTKQNKKTIMAHHEGIIETYNIISKYENFDDIKLAIMYWLIRTTNYTLFKIICDLNDYKLAKQCNDEIKHLITKEYYHSKFFKKLPLIKKIQYKAFKNCFPHYFVSIKVLSRFYYKKWINK